MLELPKSIAIIMDGNGRWAQRKGFEIRFGHKKGAESLLRIIRYCKELGIKTLTVYAFSTENWKRSEREVGAIMRLLKYYLTKNKEEFYKNNIKLFVMGDLDRIDQDMLKDIREVEEKTKNNDGLFFNVAFSYGGRREIVHAAKNIAKDFKEGNLNLEDLDENTFRKYLYNPDIVDPDLIIRTGGDLRVSNFLLWELSYSELYFTNTLWPDFDEKALDLALEDYKHRKRTYGERKAKR